MSLLFMNSKFRIIINDNLKFSQYKNYTHLALVSFILLFNYT